MEWDGYFLRIQKITASERATRATHIVGTLQTDSRLKTKQLSRLLLETVGYRFAKNTV